MKNIYIFSPPATAVTVTVPYLWLLLKAYFEENASEAAKQDWLWIEPLWHNNEDLFEMLEQNPPNVFGISVYLWNEDIVHKVAAEVKERWPSCLIIMGGPQQDTTYSKNVFQKHRHLDLVCKTDGYGEIFITELLEQITRDKLDYNKIPWCLYPTKSRDVLTSTVDYNIKEFKWPKGTFTSNKKVLLDFKNYAEDRNLTLTTVYETSRGCPYGCTFCEFGRANNKTTFKPIEYVKKEIDCFRELQITDIEVADANTGIVKRDFEIIDYFLDSKKRSGYPKFLIFSGFTKNNIDAFREVAERMFLFSDEPDIKISVQDFEQEPIAAVKRTDIAWQNKLRIIRDLQVKYPTKKNANIQMEMIIGLPLSSYQGFFKSIYYEFTENIWVKRYHWQILKDTPSYDPDYIKKYSLDIRSVLAEKNGFGVQHFSICDFEMLPLQKFDVVVGSSTYTRDQWARMFILSKLLVVTQYANMISPVLRLTGHLGLDPGNFMKIVADSIIFNDDLAVGKGFNRLKKHILSALENEEASIEFIPITDNSKNYVYIESYILMLWLLHYKEIYNSIADICKTHYQYNNDKILSLLGWLACTVKTVDYDPTKPKYLESEYDWFDFVNGEKIIPKYKSVVYKVEDISYNDRNILWHSYDQTKKILFVAKIQCHVKQPIQFHSLRKIK